MNNLPKPVAQTFAKMADFCGFQGIMVPRGGVHQAFSVNGLAAKFPPFHPRKTNHLRAFAQPVHGGQR